MFPPVPPAMIERGYQDFADRWNPILDVFDEVGVRFAHEVHPSEIAYDYWTTKRALEAIGHRPAFGLNWDPSHFVWQDLDPVNFIFDFADRIYHVDCKDAKVRTGDGRRGRLASHLPWADLRRGWDFVSTGHGDVPWEDCFRALNAIGYDGPDLDRVGGRRHGPPGRRARGARSSSAGSPSTPRPPPSTRPSPATGLTPADAGAPATDAGYPGAQPGGEDVVAGQPGRADQGGPVVQVGEDDRHAAGGQRCGAPVDHATDLGEQDRPDARGPRRR